MVDTVCPANDLMLTTEPEDQEYVNQTLACFKTEINDLRRKRPFKCIDRHDNVSKQVMKKDKN